MDGFFLIFFIISLFLCLIFGYAENKKLENENKKLSESNQRLCARVEQLENEKLNRG